VLQNSGTTKNLRGISTYDGVNAVAVGEKGTVATTDNEGRPSWNLQPSPTDSNFNSVTSISPWILLAVGSKDSVYRSTDRGATWQGARSWVRGECWTHDIIFQLSSVDFDSSTRECVAVGDQTEAIFSGDSGKHWEERLPYAKPGWHLSNLQCVSSFLGIILSTGTSVGYPMAPHQSELFTTTDQGDTWSNGTTDLSGVSMLGLTFYGCDSKTWTLVGEGGYIFHSKNKGSTWDMIPSGTRANLNAVRFAADSLYGYIAGDSGVILMTRDGGYNWSRQFPPTKKNLRSVALADPFHVYICGDSGTILWTQDAGWSGVSSQSGEVVMNIQTYPNPLSSKTTIQVFLRQSGHLNLRIFNILGIEVANIANDQYEAGSHSFEWNASDIPNGIYVCRLESGGQSIFSQVVVAK